MKKSKKLLPGVILLMLGSTATFAAEEPDSVDTLADLRTNFDGAWNNEIAKAISKRFDFLDITYVSPDENNSKDGWKAAYDWSMKRNSGKGYVVENDRALVRNFSFNLSLQGTYSYGSADNDEDYSKAKFELGIERGDFGIIAYVAPDTVTEPYQDCLDPLDISSADYLSEAERCRETYGQQVLADDAASVASFWTLHAHGGIEGDQNYDVKNKTYGASFYYVREKLPAFGMILDQVDPADNDQRKMLAGSDKFDRLTLELAYDYDLSQIADYPLWFFMDYRYFYELSAPSAIKIASMDKFGFFSASLRFSARILSDYIDTDETMLFLRYTNGQLPFDLQTDTAIELGFTTNINSLAKLFTK